MSGAGKQQHKLQVFLKHPLQQMQGAVIIQTYIPHLLQ